MISFNIAMDQNNSSKQDNNNEGYRKCDRIIKGLDAGVCDLKDYGSSIIGYKKIASDSGSAVAEVLIPNDGKSIVIRPYKKLDPYDENALGISCKLRTNQYNITKIFGKKDGAKYCSIHEPQYKYEEGGKYREPNMNKDVREECTTGLYFFMNEGNAYNYL
jgi:hypothetical protein